jgi:hypothetical protein
VEVHLEVLSREKQWVVVGKSTGGSHFHFYGLQEGSRMRGAGR